MDATWRRSRFNALIPFIASITSDVYRQQDKHQTVLILEKSGLNNEGPISILTGLDPCRTTFGICNPLCWRNCGGTKAIEHSIYAPKGLCPIWLKNRPINPGSVDAPKEQIVTWLKDEVERSVAISPWNGNGDG